MKIIKYTSIILISVVGFLLLSVFLLQHNHTIIVLHTALHSSFNFCLWRYSFIAIILIGWSYWIRAISRFCHWDPEFTEILIGKRLWAGLFFISIEILIWWGQHA